MPVEVTPGKTRNRRSPPRRGLAAAEFAVCLPVVVLIVMATIEACSMVFLKQTLTVAAYEGARTALTPAATTSTVETTCGQILSGRWVEGATVTVRPSDIAALDPGDFVDVTVTAPCDRNSVVPNAFYRGRTLSGTVSMMIEN